MEQSEAIERLKRVRLIEVESVRMTKVDQSGPKRLERSGAIERIERFEQKVVGFSLFRHGETPTAAALAGAEGFAVATRRATVGSRIFPALIY